MRRKNAGSNRWRAKRAGSRNARPTMARAFRPLKAPSAAALVRGKSARAFTRALRSGA
jgi:hypothetical protein